MLQPQPVFLFSGRTLPWFAVGAFVFIGTGFTLSLIHGMHGVSQLGMLYLPSAWLATFLMLTMAFWSAFGLISGQSMPFLFAQAVAPTGCMFTFLAIWSGAMWERAIFGVWWITDAHLIAELLLFVIYLAIVAMPSLITDARRSDHLIAKLALLGVSLVPILFFVLEWSPALSGAESEKHLQVDPQLVPAMILVAIGLWLYATCVGLMRLRCLIKEREFGLIGM